MPLQSDIYGLPDSSAQQLLALYEAKALTEKELHEVSVALKQRFFSQTDRFRPVIGHKNAPRLLQSRGL